MSLFNNILLLGKEKSKDSKLSNGNCSISYESVIESVFEMTEKLEDNGIRSKDKVLVLISDPIQLLIILFSLNNINAIFIPLYVRTGEQKIKLLLKTYDINYVIAEQSEYINFLSYKYDKTSIEGRFDIYKLSEIKGENLDNVSMILFTSGTTNIPKAVMLSEENIISNILGICDYLDADSTDNFLIIKNLCHSSTIVGELLVGIYLGASIHFAIGVVRAEWILKVINDKRISVLFAIPTLLVNFLKNPSQKLSNLRIVHFYGEPMPSSNIEQLINCAPSTEYIYSYGLTEASPRVTYIKTEDLKLFSGSSGKPIQNVAIEIVDNNHNLLEPGKIGEISIRGPNIMQGYYRDSLLTEEKLQNGKLYTGDLGYIDAANNLFVIGRKDNMFIIFGRNVYPEEIECVLCRYSDIVASIVKLEEGKIIAYIVMTDDAVLDEKELYQFCRSNLENYKIPSSYIVLDELPRTETGKVYRGK